MGPSAHAERDPVMLPVMPPIAPMLASPGGTEVPVGEPGEFSYEPKWDGFRTILFRDGDDVVVQGRSGDDLSYAFPEIVSASLNLLPARIVLDGELVVLRGERLDFEALGSRIRPRSEAGKPSIQRLAEQHPAQFVAFDILALGNDDLMAEPCRQRRKALVQAVGGVPAPFFVTRETEDADLATTWFHQFEGGGLDGLIVRRLTDPYTPGKRTLTKIKHRRTLDAVVAGWRPHTSSPDQVGSLLLGLYDDAGRLHHVGVSSGFSARRRVELADELRPFTLPEGSHHPWMDPSEGTRVPGGVNRWSKGREVSWTPLIPTRVAEVSYDQFEGDRLRHVATWQRWRPDREPHSCTYEQVARPVPYDVTDVLR